MDCIVDVRSSLCIDGMCVLKLSLPMESFLDDSMVSGLVGMPAVTFGIGKMTILVDLANNMNKTTTPTITEVTAANRWKFVISPSAVGLDL